MAAVTMFFHGGSSYAPFDTSNPRHAEEFRSLALAKEVFRHRAESRDSCYPCVESPEAWIFFGRAEDCVGADYPDAVLTLGPRGGVRVAPA